MKNSKKILVIIEGCDCQGKTYLANQILEKYRNNILIHNAVTNDIKKLHENTVQLAVSNFADEHIVVIDRLHLSEYIYGTIFRQKVSYDIQKFDRNLDKLCLDKNIQLVKILCKIDRESTLETHKSRINQEMFSDVSKVYDMYSTVTTDLNLKNWIIYNWKNQNFDLDTFTVTDKN